MCIRDRTISCTTKSKKEAIMTLKTEKFARKPFYIDAVQVTDENLQEVADWCQGEVRTEVQAHSAPSGETGQAKYVKVRVHRALNERQTKAFVGDRVLYAGSGFKVYTEKAFENCFEAVDGVESCLLYTSDAADDLTRVDLGGRRII